MNPPAGGGRPIRSWRRFAYCVRARQPKLLRELHRFPDAVLVTGCQRSGGTMLSRVITNSGHMTRFWSSRDEELDAALILSGWMPHRARGRYCFQTTYLNERWPEYLEQTVPFRMVWSLRNPASVVYSMVYNWRRFALNELFLHCGYAAMDHEDRVRFQRLGLWGIPPVRRAAYAYVGKVSQLFELERRLPPGALTVLEYDRLVQHRQQLLPTLFERLGLPPRAGDADAISERSLHKKDQLDTAERVTVERLCAPTFELARERVNL